MNHMKNKFSVNFCPPKPKISSHPHLYLYAIVINICIFGFHRKVMRRMNKSKLKALKDLLQLKARRILDTSLKTLHIRVERKFPPSSSFDCMSDTELASQFAV